MFFLDFIEFLVEKKNRFCKYQR
ncbi:hypothetical protein GS518_14410 [Leptospira interrogans]|nr:hypothetical protein F3G11_14360 [Leptospira interrogans serovar Copenhageni]QCO35101.1 hypothetical protein E4414_02630 [Leptospira interrogans]QOI48695.1 hypothetical protein Lepto898_15315 [Leptospira interrogans serovar Icterohaemorrhagiae]MTY93129.1 hypothetical protein [Leptospira interrogans serovar Copenhageni]NUL40615.1 hypothetical protein [Leptospira interrogans serovar Copenhageni]